MHAMDMDHNQDPISQSMNELHLQEEEEEDEDEEFVLGQNYEEQEVVLEQNYDLEEEIRKITGYKFKDPGLLEQAFTHKSYKLVNPTTTPYLRLEYMGAAVLNLLLAKEHYNLNSDSLAGDLTRLRAANVDTEKLARVVLKHQLHNFLRHRKPFLAGQLKEFKEATEEYPLHSSGLVYAPKALADIVKSLVAAIYIDSNSTDTSWKVAWNLMQPMITSSTKKMHPKSLLYEICQKYKFKIEIKDYWEETGEVVFLVENEFVGKAKYSGKRSIAYNRAAYNAYREIQHKLNQDQK